MKRVLIVEDNDDLRDVTTHYLRSHGFEVLAEIDGSKLDKVVSEFTPQIVVMDVNLPGRNGDVLAQQLKSDLSTQHIPIVLISSLDNLKKIASSAGVDAQLHKPFALKDLIKVVQKVIS